MTGTPEVGRQAFGDSPVVFDHEHAHPGIVR
jgi:hypothetical protein